MTASCVDCKLESSRCNPAFNFSSYQYCKRSSVHTTCM